MAELVALRLCLAEMACSQHVVTKQQVMAMLGIKSRTTARRYADQLPDFHPLIVGDSGRAIAEGLTGDEFRSWALRQRGRFANPALAKAAWTGGGAR